MKMTTKQLRKTIQRVIIESWNTWKDPNESIREAEEALLQFDDWDQPENEILEWWIHNAKDLIKYLPDVNWDDLPMPCNRARVVVMQEFGMIEDEDEDDGYWGSEPSHYDESGELLPDVRDADIDWA